MYVLRLWTCLMFCQLSLSSGITTHSVTGCSDSVLLNCSYTEMIHVERITFYNGTDCNQAVTDLQVCGQPVTGNDTEFIPYCNGKTSCNEILRYSYCPGSKAAKVDYRCIPGNDVKDMCDEFIIEDTNRIFLSTPNYPLPPTFNDISPCRCSIRGSSITSIQILELILHTSNDGTKSSLEINYGDVTYKTESFRKLFNKRLSGTSTTAEIIFNLNGIDDQYLWRQYLWIEVQGIAMRVFCNDDSHAISSTLSSTSVSPTTSSPSSSSPPTRPTLATTSEPVSKESTIEPISSTTPIVIQTPDSSSSTTPDSSSPTADIKFHTQDKDTTIIILAVLLSLCLLIICIAAIIVIVFLRRKKLVCMNRRESNAYSGLDRTQRSSGNDGSYQELNTMNPTPQYYNTSQNTQHDYQYVS